MRIFSDSLEVEIVSAEPEVVLRVLSDRGITLRAVRYVNDLTRLVIISRQQFSAVEAIAAAKGASVHVVKQFGFRKNFLSFLRRPVMVIGVLAVAILTMYLPSRVLFVEIEGNEYLPENLIIEKAAKCGISFGASRRTVRSEKVKNQLLKELPQLRWIGVNTSGCTAVITVRELVNPTTEHVRSGVSHVVAMKDAIITDITVYRGLQLCGIGEAVCRGERLVSGYVDHGLFVEGTQADAEIWGYTGNIQHLRTMRNGIQKTRRIETKRYYSLLLGKKLINFGKGSGISGSECDRMYSESYLVLPGGFRLPVALVCEQVSRCLTAPYDRVQNEDIAWMEETARSYLQDHILSGVILDAYTQTKEENDVICFYGTYRCHEIVGKIQYERN